MEHWWTDFPWRMIQTNLREIDMEDIDADKFAQDIKDFGATAVTVNAAGIVASYDTALPFHTKSEHLNGDSLGKIVDACHRAGLRVIARTDFSKIRYPLYEQHPDWAFKTAKGDIFNCNGDVQVCPSGWYASESVREILRELFKRFDFDGIFFNMSGAFVTGYDGTYYGPCMCDRCRELYKKATGLDAPSGNPRDPAFMRYVGFQTKLIGENRKKQYELIKSIAPEAAVNGFDYRRSECNTDIGHGAWVYGASANARAGGRQQIIDNAGTDFISFRYRHTSVSPALAELRQWQSLANGGGLSYFIMGRLDNHRDTSCFEPVKKVFDFHRRNEDVYKGLVSAAQVLLARGGAMGRNEPEADGWVEVLTKAHIPFDEVKAGVLTAELVKGKKVLILCDVKNLSPAQAKLIDGFAESGGTVIATGGTGIQEKNGESLLRCLGIQTAIEHRRGLMSSVVEVAEEEAKLFPRSIKAPYIALGGDFWVSEFEDDTRRYLRLVPEQPYGPPERCFPTEFSDIPGVTVRPYGEGQGITIPWLIGSFYYSEGWENTQNLMEDILFELSGLPDLAPGLSPMVELTLASKGTALVCQLVNTSGCFANRFFPPLPVRDICIELPKMQAGRVYALNGGQVTADSTGDRLILTLDELREYEAIVIEA